MNPGQKGCLLVLTFLLLILPLSACSLLHSPKTVQRIARYGNAGRALALDLAQAFPFRVAGSPEESALADRLVEELQKLGIQGEKQPFSFRAADGSEKTSYNVVAEIPGRGLEASPYAEDDPLRQSQEMQAPQELAGRRILIGAHYDSAYSAASAAAADAAAREAQVDENGQPIQSPDLPPLAESDGIDDNLAAVASLLTLARQCQAKAPAFDLTLIFFGAGHADQAGARAYAASLTDADLAKIQCMVNLEAIYAGDKVYAHAGQNSVIAGEQKNYRLRQSLYVCTDIYYNNLLLTRNGFALYTNQAGFRKKTAAGVEGIYREWSEKISDHTPFDERGIPVVFFDSANYDLENAADKLQETSDPYFAAADGQVAGGPYDSSTLLTRYFVPEGAKRVDKFGSESSSDTAQPSQENTSETAGQASVQEALEIYLQSTDLLEIRINNLAFILYELALTPPPATAVRGA